MSGEAERFALDPNTSESIVYSMDAMCEFMFEFSFQLKRDSETHSMSAAFADRTIDELSELSGHLTHLARRIAHARIREVESQLAKDRPTKDLPKLH